MSALDVVFRLVDADIPTIYRAVILDAATSGLASTVEQ